VSEATKSFRLVLPEAPHTESGPVKSWSESITIRTYRPSAPDKNPLFLEKRVYQGSSGRVYPLPVIDRIATEPELQAWDAVHIENEYIRVMVLPQIGGRIHIGLDKRNGYDFFYRQNVIKPALVGLAGPWISGGVEFNWPQHHRPATFMPVEVEIEREADGSVTVWCSDHDPMTRMKGMHGIRLSPGRTYLEVRVRLYNRTTDTQTFLWWANVATRVHERYQSFFPRDVRMAADHAKRATTEFPLSQGKYYGVDYGERGRTGVPADEMPSQFVPDGSYPPNDLSWYANIPVPTSYMIAGSRGDFAGGYDHAARAGLVYFADHHIAPGKKQWTWGNHEFGYAWDRSLTDEDGPYVELMAGAYTDNQPDFSFLAPGETKTFSQYWYPIRTIGVPDLANLDAAVHVETTEGRLAIGIEVTRRIEEAEVLVTVGGKEIARWEGTLSPSDPLSLDLEGSYAEDSLEVTIEAEEGVILRYVPAEIPAADPPQVAKEPLPPGEVATLEELYLIGLHLEQYRHPTRYPEEYWNEALKRDEGDSRVNNALGRFCYRRGEFERAGQYLRRAIARLTERNPNPYDGEPLYNLGLVELMQGKTAEAYDHFYKATWNAAWRGPAYQRLAEIDCQRRQWKLALDHIERSLKVDADNLNARNLKAIALEELHFEREATALLEETRALDPLDVFSRYLSNEGMPQDPQLAFDLALDLERCGHLADAIQVLNFASGAATVSHPMLHYAAAHILAKLDRHEESLCEAKSAASASPDYVFPSRLEEMVLLREAITRNADDARAPYYLGNFMYDRKRHEEAIQLWEKAAVLDPKFPTVFRNLGFGYFNIRHDEEAAVRAFDRAFALDPRDARVLYESDQLLKRIGRPLAERLARLQQYPQLVQMRDDLLLEQATLLSSLGQPDKALELLLARHFQPWEGGEGQVLTQYMRAHTLLARRALKANDPIDALEHLDLADTPPASLSEAKHLLMNRSPVDYFAGLAEKALGRLDAARQRWLRAARSQSDFQQMQTQEVSPMTFWSAMSLKELGEEKRAAELFERIEAYARDLSITEPKIDYFATSLPAMLLFEEDLKAKQQKLSDLLRAQVLLGGGGEKLQQAREALERLLVNDRDNGVALDLLDLFGGR
jgi:tetratricopeptide (TPR) repeat protein